MKILFLIPCLVISLFGFSQEYPLAEVLSKMETRFKIKLVYANEILFLRNGEKATVTFDGTKYKEEELFKMLGQTLGLSFKQIDNRPNQYVVQGRIARIEERLRSMERELNAMNITSNGVKKLVDENNKVVESIDNKVQRLVNNLNKD